MRHRTTRASGHDGVERVPFRAELAVAIGDFGGNVDFGDAGTDHADHRFEHRFAQRYSATHPVELVDVLDFAELVEE